MPWSAASFRIFWHRDLDRSSGLGPFAVDLDAVVAELPGAADYLFQGKRIASVPHAAIGDAVKSDFDLSPRRRRRRKRARSQNALHEATA